MAAPLIHAQGDPFLVDWNETIAPSMNDTALGTTDLLNETEVPSETLAPSITLSAPSAAPVAIMSIEGMVPLKLMNTPSLLIGSTEVDFLNAVGAFLTEKVVNTVGGGESIDLVQIGLLRQYRSQSRRRLTEEDHTRSLQGAPSSPLYVDLRVLGRLQSRSQTSSSFDFDGVLRLLFDTFAEEFVTTLQAGSDDSFFDSLVTVEVVSSDSVPTSRPADSPTFNDSAPSIFDTFDDGSNGDEEASSTPWSIGVIVGVAAAGAVIVILLLLIVCRLTTGKGAKNHAALSEKREKTRISPSGSGSGHGKETTASASSNDTVAQKKKKWLNSNPSASYDSEAARSISLQQQASDLESQGLYSYVKNDSDSYMGGSVMNSNSVMGMDNMSYAYSLEPGIEPSVAEAYAGDQSTFHEAVPIEIPQITVIEKKGKGRTARNARNASKTSSLGQGSSSDFGLAPQDQSMERPLSPSDLQLTESELDMLPSNLRAEAEKLSRPPTKVVMAPSGKLGIVIDTTVDGPVVHHVNETSNLKGKIFPGDIIVAIDDIDTRAMSAAAITALMVKTANQTRKLTVLDTMKTKKKKKSSSTKR